MTFEQLIIGAFVLMTIWCVFKKQYAGAGFTLLIGFVVVTLWGDSDYWHMGGRSLLDSAISIISGLRFKK